MIALIIFTATIFWLLASVATSYLLLDKYKNLGWARLLKSSFLGQSLFAVLIFSCPFMPGTLFHFYQDFTMPYVCDRLAGFEFYKPVKVSSYYANNNPLAVLQIKNVNFTEWQKIDDVKNQQGVIKNVKYRFSYFPDGARECKRLLDVFPKASQEIKRFRNVYKENGYPLSEINGMCIGVNAIDFFEARYAIQQGPIEKIGSGFGYDVTKSYIQLVDITNNSILSKIQFVSAKTRNFLLSFIAGSSSSEMPCPIFEPTPNGRELNKIINDRDIRKWFFDFN